MASPKESRIMEILSHYRYDMRDDARFFELIRSKSLDELLSDPAHAVDYNGVAAKTEQESMKIEKTNIMKIKAKKGLRK